MSEDWFLSFVPALGQLEESSVNLIDLKKLMNIKMLIDHHQSILN